jgi:hypothetical protein
MHREFADYANREGAEVLKACIESYWRALGFEVFVSPAPAGFTPQLRGARFDMTQRSDQRLAEGESEGRTRAGARASVADLELALA